MKKYINIPGILLSSILFLSGICSFHAANGQNVSSAPGDSQLYKTIFHMDSTLFNAFNTQNLDVLKTLFAENLEFYHDGGGLSDYKTNMETFRQNFERNVATPLKRELVAGTLEVYPIPGYGAVEMGVHRFIHTENGKQVTGTYKFSHIWQYKDSAWKITRVISVGH